jgi:hypothetical protein
VNLRIFVPLVRTQRALEHLFHEGSSGRGHTAHVNSGFIAPLHPAHARATMRMSYVRIEEPPVRAGAFHFRDHSTDYWPGIKWQARF